MTTYTWTGTSGSDWATSTNWNPNISGGPSGSGNAASILTAGTVVEDATATIGTLTLSGNKVTTTLQLDTSHVLTVATSLTTGGGTAVILAAASGTSTFIVNGAASGANESFKVGNTSGSATLVLSGTGSSTLALTIAATTSGTNTLDFALTGAGNSVTGVTLSNASQVLEIGNGGATQANLTATSQEAVTSATLNLQNGLFTDAAGVANNGTITGYGTLAAAVTGSSGSIIANGGTLNLQGGAAVGQSFSIANLVGTLSTLRLGGTSMSYTSGSAIALSSSTQKLEIGTTAAVTINQQEVVSGGILQLDGGSLTDSSGLVINSGTVTGIGTINPAISGTGGTIIATGGTLDLVANLGSLSQVIDIDTASVLRLDGSVASGNTFTFLSGSSGHLNYTSATGGITGTLSGLNVGTSNSAPTNFIDFTGQSGVTVTSGFAQSGAGTATVKLSNGSTLTLSNLAGSDSGTWYVDSQSDGAGGTEFFLSNQVCYAAGTRVLTATGEREVELLQPGDVVLTLAGDTFEAHPVKWIGRRRLDLMTHPRPLAVAPIRIARGAFADAMPHRDLLVSPDHAILVDGALVCARQLVNGTTIRQETDWTSVVYYHVELESHAILLAEGLPAESYLDTGNRGFFANSGAPLVLHPDLTDAADYPAREIGSCAPFVSDAADVRPVWQRLAARAAALGQPAPQAVTTDDPELCVVAKGQTLRPLYSHNGRHVFALPAGTAEIRIVSRASAPTDVRPWLEDRRELGVYVSRLVLRGAHDVHEVPVDHPDLSHGWWAVERDGAALRRWTNGNAIVPLPQGTAATMLEVHASHGGLSYLVGEIPYRRAA